MGLWFFQYGPNSWKPFDWVVKISKNRRAAGSGKKYQTIKRYDQSELPGLHQPEQRLRLLCMAHKADLASISRISRIIDRVFSLRRAPSKATSIGDFFPLIVQYSTGSSNAECQRGNLYGQYRRNESPTRKMKKDPRWCRSRAWVASASTTGVTVQYCNVRRLHVFPQYTFSTIVHAHGHLSLFLWKHHRPPLLSA